jgi:hypothetical protein
VRDSDAIRAWWAERLNGILAEPDESVRVDRALAMETRLVGLDKAVPRWTAPVGAGREGAWVRNVERAGAQRRDEMIGEFLRTRADGAWSAADEAGLAERYSGWTAAAEGVLASALGAERLMDAGYGLDEAPAGGGETVAQLAGAAGAPGMEQLREALSPVMSRVEALRGVSRAAGPADVVALVTHDPSNRPELTVAAWRRLGQLNAGSWPASAADLEKETSEFPAALRAVLKHEGVAGRRAELAREIGEVRQARWESFIKRATTEADLERALDSELTVSRLEVDPARAADPLVRYRLGAYELRKAIAAPGLSDAQVRAAVKKFVEGVPAEVAGDARAAALLTGLGTAVSDAEESAPKVDPKRLGPGAMGGWAPEELQAPDGRSLLRFTRDRLKLEFVRVEAGPGVPEAVYLGTDEVSLGQFTQIINTAGESGWQAVQELMPTAEDVPAAPRAWVWGAARGGEATRLRQAQDWIQTSRPGVGVGDNRLPAYAPRFLRVGGDGKQMPIEMAPRQTSPMQFVSPAAAIYSAALVGCRIPTPAEWQLAASTPAAERAVNLRDRAWGVQQAYVVDTRRARGAVQDQFLWPDSGAFQVAGAADGESAVLAAPDQDDQWVWFEQVIEGATGFAHLRGNVAEYVLSGAPEELASPDARGAADVVKRRAREIGVMGASALSAPEVRPETVYPAPQTDAETGWADVGFRLAFTATGTRAPRRSKAEIVGAILTGPGADPYLLKN